MAPTPTSSLEDSSVIDLTFSYDDTLELPPCSPPIEVVDTYACVKICFPEEIPDEVLGVHLRHHFSGQGGISPRTIMVYR